MRQSLFTQNSRNARKTHSYALLVLQSVARKANGFLNRCRVASFLFFRCKATVQHLFVALILSRADSWLAWRVA
jgi:hypothetical protein